MPALTALSEADARLQLAALPHDCGELSFAPPMRRSHDELGLWLVFRGPCPRCGAARELRFHAAAPAKRAAPLRPSGPAPAATAPSKPVFRGGSEERELYRPDESTRCTGCGGVGERTGLTGDYAMGLVRCGECGGSGWVTPLRE